MPAFSEHGRRTFVSYITGPSHIRLGLTLTDSGSTPLKLVCQKPIVNSNPSRINETKLTGAVLQGVAAVSPDLQVEEIIYLADDSPNYNLFRFCAKLLAERYVTRPA